MSLFQVNYPSDVMNKYMGMNVILPDEDRGFYDEEGKYPVLYLLHGYTDDYTKWARMTSIERYAADLGFAVVMPEGGKSFYTDMAHGDPYFTQITEEIPKYLKKWFPITQDPKYTFIAGLSMGGYGAMKIGMTYPDRYSVIGSFSGALLMAQTAAEAIADDAEAWLKRLEADIRLVFDDVHHVVGGPEDLLWLAADLVAKKEERPNMYLSCGTDDFILESTAIFCKQLDALKLDYKYYEGPGAHEWAFWDQEVLKFMHWIRSLRD